MKRQFSGVLANLGVTVRWAGDGGGCGIHLPETERQRFG